jgi:hypothetical protein
MCNPGPSPPACAAAKAQSSAAASMSRSSFRSGTDRDTPSLTSHVSRGLPIRKTGLAALACFVTPGRGLAAKRATSNQTEGFRLGASQAHRSRLLISPDASRWTWASRRMVPPHPVGKAHTRCRTPELLWSSAAHSGPLSAIERPAGRLGHPEAGPTPFSGMGLDPDGLERRDGEPDVCRDHPPGHWCGSEAHVRHILLWASSSALRWRRC